MIQHVKISENDMWEYGETIENGSVVSKWCKLKEYPKFDSIDWKNTNKVNYCTKPGCHPTRVICVQDCDWRK